MKQNIIRHEKQSAIQLFIVGLLLYLLGRQSLKVENGQFERQYSIIYTSLVLGIITVLLLVLIILAWKVVRFLFKRDESSGK